MSCSQLQYSEGPLEEHRLATRAQPEYVRDRALRTQARFRGLECHLALIGQYRPTDTECLVVQSAERSPEASSRVAQKWMETLGHRDEVSQSASPVPACGRET